MGWMAPVLAVVGSLYQAKASKDAASYNAGVDRQEAGVIESQALGQEAITRQTGRETLGRAAAAVAQSGTGTGGSSGRILDQDAVNEELDALTVRYRGQLGAAGYRAQAKNEATIGNVGATNAYLSAGANLLKAKAAWSGPTASGA